ncbi:MAG: CoA synthetase [Alphaproteobacteria bacterium]|nr:CoA synthetase [Alphaproteobacteria bacterium]
MTAELLDLDALAARVPDGAVVAVPPDYSGVALAATLALIARGVRGLHLVGVPSTGFQGDWLVGGGCVATIEAAAVTIGEYGPAPRFTAAMKAGAIRMVDGTCPAIHAGLQAAEKGLPFLPLRGIIGSDLAVGRDDWKLGANPFAADDPILMIRAIRPDIALFHAARADRAGNVWIGVRRELMLMAHAARQTLVTVEEIVNGDLLDDDATAAGTIPALYVSAIAEARHGMKPLGLRRLYGPDDAALRRYIEMARTDEGFRTWLGEMLPRAKVAE